MPLERIISTGVRGWPLLGILLTGMAIR